MRTLNLARRAIRAAGLLTALAPLVALAGCGTKGPEVVPVSGTVTRGGEPVANLYLDFIPDEGRPSWGITDERGRFTLDYSKDQKGARVGMHTVAVKYKPRSMAEEIGQAPSRAPKDITQITSQYGINGSSPLRIEIAKATSDLKIKLD